MTTATMRHPHPASSQYEWRVLRYGDEAKEGCHVWEVVVGQGQYLLIDDRDHMVHVRRCFLCGQLEARDVEDR